MESRDLCGFLCVQDQSSVFCTICHCGHIYTTALRMMVVWQVGHDWWCNYGRFTINCFKIYRTINRVRPRLIARPAATSGNWSHSVAWLVARPVLRLDSNSIPTIMQDRRRVVVRPSCDRPRPSIAVTCSATFPRLILIVRQPAIAETSCAIFLRLSATCTLTWSFTSLNVVATQMAGTFVVVSRI